MRTNEIIWAEQIHRGSINSICPTLSGQIITGSADKTLIITDVLSGFKKAGVMRASDSVFDAISFETFSVAGCGDGSVLVFDNDTQECLYGFGVMNQGGVRCLKLSDDYSRFKES